MMRMSALSVLALLAVAFCGCRTSYQEAVAARQDVIYGTGDYARERAAKMANSTVNRKLGSLELGRLKMLQGDFSGSSAVLGPQMEDLFDETNEGPVLKKGQIAGNILAGTVGDDRAIPYELPAFELLFGLQYQALNALSLGEPDNARAYLRRATAVQEQLKMHPYAAKQTARQCAKLSFVKYKYSLSRHIDNSFGCKIFKHPRHDLTR